MHDSKIHIVDYAPEHQPWFEQLNRAWIERYFSMEPPDFDILLHPETFILKDGGSILMAAYENKIVGTVALKRHSGKLFEMTKMAVDEAFRGKKIGKTLATAAIERAKGSGAEKIVLYSNTMLESAIALYERLGFREIPVDGPYKRSNIKMELVLS